VGRHIVYRGQKGKKKYYPCHRLWRPIEVFDADDLRLSRQLAHRWQFGSSMRWLCFPPTTNLLVFISVGGLVNPGATASLEGLGKWKNIQ
jgi:hypothetical protein